MVRVERVELSSYPWEGYIIAAIRHPRAFDYNTKYLKYDKIEIMSKNKKFGDRKDGKRVRNLSGLAQISIDLKPNRSVSDVYINQKMDVTELVKYVTEKKKNGEEITYFHAFVTAIGKLLYNRPYMNRFVANRHLYEHNDVVIAFVAKVSFDDRAEEVMVQVSIEKSDNVSSVKEKILKELDKYRKRKKINKKGANNIIDTLGKMPNALRIPVMGMFKWVDKKGLLPLSLTKDNLYYSSIIVSNLGSIKCGAIFHNINDFGTCSSLGTFGEVKEEKGKYYCDFGINLDERIADGYYFAKSLKMLQFVFDNPKMLEERADAEIVFDELR